MAIKNIEVDVLTLWLQQHGISEVLITRAIRQLGIAAAPGGGKKLYYTKAGVYQLLPLWR